MQQIFLKNIDHPYYNKESIEYTKHSKLVEPFINVHARIENVEALIKAKRFSAKKRELLVDTLRKQYAKYHLKDGNLVKKNIDSLLKENTYTITTGQQIHLFLGPMFVIYKALSVIGTSKELKQRYPNANFVPVFWMASEDHDFEEINHVNIYSNKIKWDIQSEGAVGRLSTKTLHQYCEELESLLDDHEVNRNYIQLFKEAYHESNNFAEASRHIFHHLFEDEGLVVLEPDDKDLKGLFKQCIKADLITNNNYEAIKSQTKKLKASGLKNQIGAQETNFFYLTDNKRVKIKKQGDIFQIGDRKLDEQELINELDRNPEKFSPNVALRPLYQEFILPNIAYIAGGSELKYWLQLKSLFDENQIEYPMVLLRNSALIVKEKNYKKVRSKLKSDEDLFLSDEKVLEELDAKTKNKKQSIKDKITGIKGSLNDLQKLFPELPIKRQPFSAYKNLEKSLSQMENVLEELESDGQNISDEIRNVLKNKNRFFSKTEIQERQKFVVEFLGNIEEIKSQKWSAFHNNLSLLIH